MHVIVLVNHKVFNFLLLWVGKFKLFINEIITFHLMHTSCALHMYASVISLLHTCLQAQRVLDFSALVLKSFISNNCFAVLWWCFWNWNQECNIGYGSMSCSSSSCVDYIVWLYMWSTI